MKIGSILFVRGISIFLYVMLTTFYPVARGTLDNYAAYNDTMNSLRYNSRRALEAFHQRSFPLGRIYAHQAKIAFETAIRYHPAAYRPYLDWGTFLLQKQALDPTGEQEASCDWLRTAWDLLQSHRKHHATSPDVSATNNHLDVDTYAGTPRSHEAKGKGEILQRERNSVQTIGWIPLARAVHFRWSQCEYSILERRYREAIDRQDVSTAIELLRLQDELLPRNVDTLYRISRLLDGDENSFQTAESVVVDGFARYLSEWDAFTHRNGCSYESRPERNAVAESSVRHSSGKNRGGVERSNARIFRKGLRWPTRFRHKIFRDTLCVPWARAYGDAAVIVPIETCDILLPLHTFSGFFLLSDHVPHFVPTYPRIPPGSRWTKTKRELQNTAPPNPLRWESREETVTWEQLWEDEESHFEYTHDRERVRIRTISEAEAGDAIALHILHNGKYESQHIPSGIRPAHLTSHGRIPSLLASPPSRARTLLHEPFPLFTDSVSFSLVTFPTILDSWRHYRSWMLDALPRLISAMPMLHTMTHDNGKGLLTLLLPIAGNSEALTSMDWTRRHLKWKEFLSLHVEKKPKTCDQRFKTRLFLPAYIHRSLSFFFSELFEAVSDRLRVLFYPQYGTIDEDQQGGGGGAYNTERLRADWLCIGNEQEGSSPEKLHRVLHAFVQTKIERTRLVEKRGKTSRTMVLLRSGLQGDSDTLRYHMEELIWEHLQTLQRTLRNQRHKTLIRIVSLWSRGRTIALTCDEEREAIGMGTAQEQQEWDGALLAKHLGNALAIIGHSDDPSMADLLFCRAGTYILELTDKSHLETNTVSLDHPWWKQFFSSLDLVHARTNYETDQNTAHSWNRETTFRSIQEALNTMWEYSIQQVSEEGQRDEM